MTELLRPSSWCHSLGTRNSTVWLVVRRLPTRTVLTGEPETEFSRMKPRCHTIRRCCICSGSVVSLPWGLELTIELVSKFKFVCDFEAIQCDQFGEMKNQFWTFILLIFNLYIPIKRYRLHYFCPQLKFGKSILICWRETQTDTIITHSKRFKYKYSCLNNNSYFHPL